MKEKQRIQAVMVVAIRAKVELRLCEASCLTPSLDSYLSNWLAAAQWLMAALLQSGSCHRYKPGPEE